MAEQVPGRVPGRMSDGLSVELPATQGAPSAPPRKATAPDVAAASRVVSPLRASSVVAALDAPESEAPAEPVASGDRTPGWREVLIIAAVVVIAVLAIQLVTSNLPVSVQNLLFNTPLVIVVLVGGTVGLLVRITRRPSR